MVVNPVNFIRRQLSFIGSGIIDRGISRLTGKKFSLVQMLYDFVRNTQV